MSRFYRTLDAQWPAPICAGLKSEPAPEPAPKTTKFLVRGVTWCNQAKLSELQLGSVFLLPCTDQHLHGQTFEACSKNANVPLLSSIATQFLTPATPADVPDAVSRERVCRMLPHNRQLRTLGGVYGSGVWQVAAMDSLRGASWRPFRDGRRDLGCGFMAGDWA